MPKALVTEISGIPLGKLTHFTWSQSADSETSGS